MINELEFKELYESGMSYAKLAIHYGISVSQAKTFGTKCGVISRKTGRQREDLTGKQIDQLLVVDYDASIHQYQCQCQCGNMTFRDYTSLMQSGTKQCWDCRNRMLSITKWKGYGEISMDKWISIKRSASVRNLEFEITMEQAWDLFESQNRKCALSGLPLEFYSKKQDRAKTSASLDRIDSTRGYTIDNVQWVHKHINSMKMDLDEAQFIQLCSMVVHHNEKRHVN